MKQPTPDLDQLEERSYRTLWADGLVDLCLGLYLLGTGLLLNLDEAPFMALVPLLIWPLWLGLKRNLIEPRAGVVRFAAGRRAKERRKRGLLMGLLGLTAVVGAIVYAFLDQGTAFGLLAVSPEERPRLLFGLMLAGVLSCAGLLYGVRRVHAYSALLVACFLLGPVLGLNPAERMIGAGAVVTVVGGLLLTRFLRATPLPESNSHVGS